MLDEASESATNGSASPSEHIKPISISGNSPHVSVSGPTSFNHQQILVEGQRQSTLVHQEAPAVRTNGHVQTDEAGRSRPKFELRAFQEEKRPAKLFSPGEEQHVRVTRTRPSEEVHNHLNKDIFLIYVLYYQNMLKTPFSSEGISKSYYLAKRKKKASQKLK